MYAPRYVLDVYYRGSMWSVSAAKTFKLMEQVLSISQKIYFSIPVFYFLKINITRKNKTVRDK